VSPLPPMLVVQHTQAILTLIVEVSLTPRGSGKECFDAFSLCSLAPPYSRGRLLCSPVQGTRTLLTASRRQNCSVLLPAREFNEPIKSLTPTGGSWTAVQADSPDATDSATQPSAEPERRPSQ
jgi:hypothetical protein